jgi:hypothetical protein
MEDWRGVTNTMAKNAILSASPPKAVRVSIIPSINAIIKFKAKLKRYSWVSLGLFSVVIICNICSTEPVPIIQIHIQSETIRVLIS